MEESNDQQERKDKRVRDQKCADLDDDADDVYASIPIVEYFREQSLASFARTSAT